MKRHVKIYMRYFNFGEQDIIYCEKCHTKAVDIHHIHGRGKGKDIIENLMALCRDCHNMVHAGKISKVELQRIHNEFLNGKL